MNDLKEEIKSRLSVEDVVGQYIELKRAGRNLKGHSPWGVDKTPSFMVSPEKGIWHDFSANKGGDIFTFIMEVEGISFREAFEKLAARAGVDVSKYQGGDKKIAHKKKRAWEALNLATKYYQACLVRNKSACNYVFYQRNLNRKTVEEFKIGYSPASGTALTTVLGKRQFTLDELNDAGLLNRYKKDLFRDRMMVPFIDTNGNVIGFTARILKKGEPKYLNTPDTILFSKSRYIFGLYQAKESIRRSGFVVIVEGNMDVISSHQAGVKEAVATSGTAMTVQQLKILSNLTSDIRLAYDGDAAGIKAAERAIELAGELDIALTVISNYHGAKDPDELIQKDPKLWQQAVDEHVPAVSWLLQKYEENLDLSLPTDKKKYSDIALNLVNNIKDEVERRSYLDQISHKLDIDIDTLLEKGDRLNKKIEQASHHKIFKQTKTTVVPNHLKKLSDSLLALKIFAPDLSVKIPLETPTEETRLGELEMIFNQEHANFNNSDFDAEATELLKRYEVALTKQKIKDLSEKLSQVEEDSEASAEILKEIASLQKKLK